MNLFFYEVDEEYVSYLKQCEIENRGFSRIPNIKYNNGNKFLVGVVLEINDFKYYVPVSSYKKKQDNNILIELKDDSFNQVKGSLRFNYMFPVPDQYIKIADFNKYGNSRKEFLRRQWVFCNSIYEDILEMANNTYNDVVNKVDMNLIYNSCDFSLLEKMAQKYIS